MKRVSLFGLVLVFGSTTSTRAIAATGLFGGCNTPNALSTLPVALVPPPRLQLSAPTGEIVSGVDANSPASVNCVDRYDERAMERCRSPPADTGAMPAQPLRR